MLLANILNRQQRKKIFQNIFALYFNFFKGLVELFNTNKIITMPIYMPIYTLLSSVYFCCHLIFFQSNYF